MTIDEQGQPLPRIEESNGWIAVYVVCDHRTAIRGTCYRCEHTPGVARYDITDVYETLIRNLVTVIGLAAAHQRGELAGRGHG